jgi:prevent-host-death family protein
MYTQADIEVFMDRYLTASQARHEFLALVDAAQRGERVIVTKRGVPAAAVVGFEELETLRALARLWQDPAALAAMRQSLEEARQGRAIAVSGPLSLQRLAEVGRRPKQARRRG